MIWNINIEQIIEWKECHIWEDQISASKCFLSISMQRTNKTGADFWHARSNKHWHPASPSKLSIIPPSRYLNECDVVYEVTCNIVRFGACVFSLLCLFLTSSAWNSWCMVLSYILTNVMSYLRSHATLYVLARVCLVCCVFSSPAVHEILGALCFDILSQYCTFKCGSSNSTCVMGRL